MLLTLPDIFCHEINIKENFEDLKTVLNIQKLFPSPLIYAS